MTELLQINLLVNRYPCKIFRGHQMETKALEALQMAEKTMGGAPDLRWTADRFCVDLGLHPDMKG